MAEKKETVLSGKKRWNWNAIVAWGMCFCCWHSFHAGVRDVMQQVERWLWQILNFYQCFCRLCLVVKHRFGLFVPLTRTDVGPLCLIHNHICYQDGHYLGCKSSQIKENEVMATGHNSDFIFLACANGPVQVKRHFRLSCDRLQSISSCSGTLWCCKSPARSAAWHGTT